MNSIDIAIEKSNVEIKKNIEKIKDLCKDSSFVEFAYIIYYIHTLRLNKSNKEKNLNNLSLDKYDDILKFSSSCIFKYSSINNVLQNNYKIDYKIVNSLIDISKHIDSLYEMLNYITFSDDVSFEGNNKKYIKIDTSKIMNTPEKKKFLEYSSRFQGETSQKNHIGHLDLLNDFENKYKKYNSISNEIFGLTVNQIKDKINQLLNIYIENIKDKEKFMTILKNGNIDMDSTKTIEQVVKSFIIDEISVFNIFGKNGMKFIRLFTFKKSDFTPYELSYHYILRRPFFKIKNQYIIVPELLLDSLFTNFHYTLLENKRHSEKHKKIMSDTFVKEILDIGIKYGFYYVDSELELYNGKNKLGDIDLILRHSEFEFDILIEAKNHAVPLSVAFGNLKNISNRLKELQINWEKKVDKRFNHIIKNNIKYNIKKEFKYIIVSRFPEVLSHFSNFLVFSIKEFDFYLKNNAKYINFDDFFHEYNENEEYSYDELKSFMEEHLNLRQK